MIVLLLSSATPRQHDNCFWSNNHPLELASILVDEVYVDDVIVICAALLHDTIEDTDTTFEELESIFRPVVTNIFREVSSDMTLSSTERRIKETENIPRLWQPAKLVKLADKIANIRDISTMPPVGWTLAKNRLILTFALNRRASKRRFASIVRSIRSRLSQTQN